MIIQCLHLRLMHFSELLDPREGRMKMGLAGKSVLLTWPSLLFGIWSLIVHPTFYLGSLPYVPCSRIPSGGIVDKPMVEDITTRKETRVLSYCPSLSCPPVGASKWSIHQTFLRSTQIWNGLWFIFCSFFEGWDEFSMRLLFAMKASRDNRTHVYI